MRNLLLIAVLLISCNSFAQVNDDNTVKTRLQNKYMQFLREEGFSPSIDGDGDVKFKKEGSIYYLRPTKDALYFKIACWLTNSNNDHSLKIFEAMNKTISNYKAVQVFLVDDYSDVCIQVSNYMASEDDFKDIFYRLLSIVVDSKSFFLEEYNK